MLLISDEAGGMSSEIGGEHESTFNNSLSYNAPRWAAVQHPL